MGLFAGIGVGGWVYNKTMRQTGNNTKNALIVASIAGGFVLLLVVIIMAAVNR